MMKTNLMIDNYDDLSIISLDQTRKKLGYPILPPATTPLSCYLLPAFWQGALAVREGKELTKNQKVRETEQKVGFRFAIRTVETATVERFNFTPEEIAMLRRRNEEALKDLPALERAAGKRDLSTLAAYHRWLAQGTIPQTPTIDDEEQS